MIEFEAIPDSNIIEFSVDGKVGKEELGELLAACEAVIAQHGKVRLLKWVKSVGGIEAGALWDNLSFGFRNLKSIERVAGVADKEWMHKLAEFSGKLVPGEVRMFSPDEIDAARAWLRE